MNDPTAAYRWPISVMVQRDLSLGHRCVAGVARVSESSAAQDHGR